MNPAEWLVRSAQRTPNAPALLRGDTVVADYDGFRARAAAMAGALTTQYEITPGDRVAIFMSNRTEYLEVMYGAWFAGATVVPINAKLHPKEAACIIEDADASLVFVSDEIRAALAEQSPDRKMLSVDGPGLRRVVRRAAGDRARRTGRRRYALAVLYLRHHRHAERRDAVGRQSGSDDICLFRGCGRRQSWAMHFFMLPRCPMAQVCTTSSES